jgi:hypothetical protein
MRIYKQEPPLKGRWWVLVGLIIGFIIGLMI